MLISGVHFNGRMRGEVSPTGYGSGASPDLSERNVLGILLTHSIISRDARRPRNAYPLKNILNMLA